MVGFVQLWEGQGLPAVNGGRWWRQLVICNLLCEGGVHEGSSEVAFGDSGDLSPGAL